MLNHQSVLVIKIVTTPIPPETPSLVALVSAFPLVGLLYRPVSMV